MESARHPLRLLLGGHTRLDGPPNDDLPAHQYGVLKRIAGVKLDEGKGGAVAHDDGGGWLLGEEAPLDLVLTDAVLKVADVGDIRRVEVLRNDGVQRGGRFVAEVAKLAVHADVEEVAIARAGWVSGLLLMMGVGRGARSRGVLLAMLMLMLLVMGWCMKMLLLFIGEAVVCDVLSGAVEGGEGHLLAALVVLAHNDACCDWVGM